MITQSIFTSWILAILTTTTHGVDDSGTIPPGAEKAVSQLNKDIALALSGFSKALEAEIAKAEGSGDVGRAGVLRDFLERNSEKLKMTIQATDATPGGDLLGSKPTLTSARLKKLFSGTTTLSKDGVTTISYDFGGPQQLRDFNVPESGVKLLPKGILEIGGALSVEHKAKWSEKVTVAMSVSHANRKGKYLQVGDILITGSNYNAWSINIDKVGGSKFSGNYTQSGDYNDIHPLKLEMSAQRILLDYGVFEGGPVQVACEGRRITGQSVQIFGAMGGARIKSLVIVGVLDADWLNNQKP